MRKSAKKKVAIALALLGASLILTNCPWDPRCDPFDPRCKSNKTEEQCGNSPWDPR
jgi:hypothetical protein